MKNELRVADNDKNEITIHLNGRGLRGWSYSTEQERRWKMQWARGYVEGWYDAKLRQEDE